MVSNEESLKGQVVHVTTEERALNYKWEKAAGKISPRVQIVSEEKLPLLCKNGQFTIPQDTALGDVLVRHPFEPSTYIHVENAAYQIRLAKFFKISQIAQKLGAVSYNIKAAWEEINERVLDINGNISYDIVQASTNIHNEDRMMQTMGLSVSAEYDGIRVISDNSQKEAERVAKQYGLWEDGAISALIRQRNPNEPNLIKGMSYTIDMTSETKRLLDAAFSINVLSSVFSLDASIKKAISTQEKITLSIVFEFPNS